MWLQKHEATTWQQTTHWLSMCGYINFKLTGNIMMEASQAARTMAYDVLQRQWSEEVLGAAALDGLRGGSSLLPTVVPASTFVGSITSDIAKRTGLAEGTPVFTGGHDHICACFASGVLEPKMLLDSFGTIRRADHGDSWRHCPKRCQWLWCRPACGAGLYVSYRWCF